MKLPLDTALWRLGETVLDIADRLHVECCTNEWQSKEKWDAYMKSVKEAESYTDFRQILLDLYAAISPEYMRPRWNAIEWQTKTETVCSTSMADACINTLYKNILWNKVTEVFNEHGVVEWKGWYKCGEKPRSKKSRNNAGMASAQPDSPSNDEVASAATLKDEVASAAQQAAGRDDDGMTPPQTPTRTGHADVASPRPAARRAGADAAASQQPQKQESRMPVKAITPGEKEKLVYMSFLTELASR